MYLTFIPAVFLTIESRYYQAWQEGTGAEDTIAEDDAAAEDHSESKSVDDESNVNISGGLWSKPDIDGEDKSSAHWSDGSDSVDSSSGSSSSWPDEDDGALSALDENALTKKLHRGSLVNLLEHENDHGFQNPLLSGLGFEDVPYPGMYDKKSAKSEDHSSDGDSVWDESSVKVDHSKSNQSILYIQVRFLGSLSVICFGKQAKSNILFRWNIVQQPYENL